MASNFFTGFLALGTGSTTFVELVGSGYARQPITFGPIVGATITDITATTFAATGTWPTATQYGLVDASGNLLLWWNRSNPASMVAGKTDTNTQGTHTMSFPGLMSVYPSTSIIFAPGTSVAVKTNGFPVYCGVAIQVANGQIGAM